MSSVRVKHRAVLPGRAQPVQAVGAWVESGPDLEEDPTALALRTAHLAETQRRTNEELLRQFQCAVRRRVGQQHAETTNKGRLLGEAQRTRQCRFAPQRRLFMDAEREEVKDEQRHREHVKSSARLKAEREHWRLQEEKKLQPRPDDRELLILKHLKREEEERAAQVERKAREDRRKEAKRFNEALRAEILERVSREKLDLPPLCSCASSVWDSHPDRCAHNCAFFHNPKAYLQLLRSMIDNVEVNRRRCR